MCAAMSMWRDSIAPWFGVNSPGARRDVQTSSFEPDFISGFCRRCGGSVGEGEYVSGRGCGMCRHQRPPWKRLVRLGVYQHELRTWIHDIKFKRNARLGWELGRRLGWQLHKAGVRADSICPVPMTRRRRVARGIDHTHVIAQGVSWATGWPLCCALRRRPRPVQRAVATSARRANVRHSMRVGRWLGVFPHRAMGCVVLVDDVLTTQATMWEATRTLVRARDVLSIDAVIAAVLAVADPPNRRPVQADSGDDGASRPAPTPAEVRVTKPETASKEGTSTAVTAVRPGRVASPPHEIATGASSVAP